MALAQAAPAAVSAAAWRVGGGVEPRLWATVARAAAVPNQGRRPRGGMWARCGSVKGGGVELGGGVGNATARSNGEVERRGRL